MPEIGATLRDARQRQRIDISEIETATKIRAKYLRALEEEDWDQLPGPTFVKTFLRTYAEALGLDAKLLVEEYKLRHERLSDAELRPISPRTAAAQQGRGRRGGGGSRPGGGGGGLPGPDRRARRDVVIAVLVLLVLGIVLVVGITRNDDEGDDQPTTSVTRSTPTSKAGTPISPGTATTSRRRPTATTVRLQLVPTGDVYVCLKDASGTTLVNGATLREDDPRRTYRSKRFALTVGNDAVKLRIDGKLRDVPESDGPVSYAIRPGGKRTTLPAARAPECAA